MSQNVPGSSLSADSETLPEGAPSSAPFQAAAVFRPLLSLLMEFALLVLGWGIPNFGMFFAHPVRVLLIVVLVLQAAFNIFRRLHLPRYNHYRIEHIGVYRVQLMAFESVMVVGAFCDARSIALMPEPIRWWGITLFFFGSIAFAWAIIRTPSLFDVAILAQDSHGLALERHAAVLPGAEPVKPRQRINVAEFRQGPYQWLRYPTSLTQLVLLVGLSLIFRAWPGLVFCCMYLAATLFRTQEMDAAYQRFYGRAWTEYTLVSRRFIPWIY